VHANQKPRLLTETEMLSIFESTDDELSAAEEKLGELAGQILDGIYEPGMFRRLVKAGVFTGSTVKVKDEPVFVLIHSRNALGWVIVEGVVAVRRGSLKLLFEAGDVLARHYEAPNILFVTRLKGLFNYARAHNFQVMGAILVKEVPA
jgi:hypothetical protein